jgi:hypothetical protein
MSIFNLYPQIDYSVNSFDTFRAIDITTAIKIKTLIKQYTAVASRPYVVLDGERPDQVSYKFYNTPDYDWVILLSNEMYSVYDDWPKSTEALDKYIIEKYGSISAAQVDFPKYFNSYGDEVSYSFYITLPVATRKTESAYQYEVRKNINKSKIKIIRPEIISQIDSNLKSSVSLAVQ